MTLFIMCNCLNIVGGPRGNKKTHKGQRRHFTDESEIKQAAEKEERQKEWRVFRLDEVDCLNFLLSVVL